jgi:hypothetical protein
MSLPVIAAWGLGAFGVATFVIVGYLIFFMMKKDEKGQENSKN